FNPNDKPVVAELKGLDVLPALNLAYQLRDGMFIRGAASRTVARPDFRELSPATFSDVTGGRQTFGNPELERTNITSAEMRFEWYGVGNEMVSLGGFAQYFENPIETIVVVSAQHSITYENADAAKNI